MCSPLPQDDILQFDPNPPPFKGYEDEKTEEEINDIMNDRLQKSSFVDKSLEDSLESLFRKNAA